MTTREEEEEEEEEEEAAAADGDAKKPADGESSLSKEELEKKTGSLLDEYLASNDEEEAAECVKELECPAMHGDLLVLMIMHVMEKKQDARDKVDRLIVHLVTKKVVESDAIASGLAEVMGQADELSMDVPKFANYVATTTGLVLAAGGLEPATLKKILAPLEGEPLMAKMLVWTIDAIQQKDGEEKAKEIYAATEVTLVASMMDGDQTAEAAKDMIGRSSVKMGHMEWMCE